MFDFVCGEDSGLVISLACANHSIGGLPSFGFSVPVSFEWLTIRDSVQSCYSWIEEAASAALCFTIRAGGFVRRIVVQVRKFRMDLCRAFRPRMILSKLKQFRL